MTSRPFSDGVTALDEALIAEPVFKSEVGLSHRRVKLEKAFAKAVRAYLEGVQGKIEDVDVLVPYFVKDLIADLPKVEGGNGIKESKY